MDDEYFMNHALKISEKSKDPVTKVGACIAYKDKKPPVGEGYNCMPNDSDEFLWDETKKYYVCHAEMNAILNTGKDCDFFKDCTIYVTLHPCNECAKMIVRSGIKKVVYKDDKLAHKEKTNAAKKIFKIVGIKPKQYIPPKSEDERIQEDNTEGPSDPK